MAKAVATRPTLSNGHNLKLAVERNNDFLERTDILILGMGGDGHIASLFPNDASSTEGLLTNDVTYINTQAPVTPIKRISCTKTVIKNTQRVYLLISGEEKREVLENENLNLPIHTILKELKNLTIYYAANK